MPISSLGDMRQHFITSRANLALKTDLQTLVQELTSGQMSDLTEHLGASQTKLAGLDRQLQMLDRYAQSNKDTGQLLSTMQTVLGGIEDHRGAASGALLTIESASSQSQVVDAGNIARSSFESTVLALNMRSGDRSMFGGNDLDANPLAPPEEMMNALRASIAGLTEAADITAAVDTWFDAPGGGFETDGYLGDDQGTISRSIDANQEIDIDLRADDLTLRNTLKAFALGALAGDTTVPLNLDTRRALQRQAGEDLLTTAAPLASVQARLGYAEGQVEQASVRITAQQSSYGIARNDMIASDPFETATRLQSVQQQLETQYTLTARLSRLSLTEYLR